MAIRGGRIDESTIAGLAGGYGNIGYMGPGLALATLGAQAAVPVALIFCFDTLLLFSLVPFMMAVASPEKKSIGSVALDVVRRIGTNPLETLKRNIPGYSRLNQVMPSANQTTDFFD